MKVRDDARLLTNATISGDALIDMDSVTIEGKADVLSNLNIQDFCQQVERTYHQMSPAEYASIQKVLNQKNGKQDDFLKLLKSHLVNFAEGIVASIVAGYLMK